MKFEGSKDKLLQWNEDRDNLPALADQFSVNTSGIKNDVVIDGSKYPTITLNIYTKVVAVVPIYSYSNQWTLSAYMEDLAT